VNYSKPLYSVSGIGTIPSNLLDYTITISSGSHTDYQGRIPIINHQPSTINHQPSTINHQNQPSTISLQPSTINHQPSTINHHPSAINHVSLAINPLPSIITH
jgi:hypothetical protein